MVFQSSRSLSLKYKIQCDEKDYEHFNKYNWNDICKDTIGWKNRILRQWMSLIVLNHEFCTTNGYVITSSFTIFKITLLH